MRLAWLCYRYGWDDDSQPETKDGPEIRFTEPDHDYYAKVVPIVYAVIEEH